MRQCICGNVCQSAAKPMKPRRNAMATPIERHFRAIVASPLGPLVLESNARALVRLALPGRDSRRPALLAGDKGDAIVEEAARQLQEYFAGQRREFDLPLEPTGTPFQRRVCARAVRDRLRPDDLVRPTGGANRQADGFARRRRGKRPQSNRAHRALPSRDRRRWLVDRLRRRTAGQGLADSPRSRRAGGRRHCMPRVVIGAVEHGPISLAGAGPRTR